MSEVQKWSIEKANGWYENLPWLVGCNFIPSNAINQLEMWQADTFDPKTIDQELGWASNIGFNSMRVYLHDLLWLQDAVGFKERIHRYLDIADRHDIRTMFVLFDDCWHDNPKLGKQPEPKPGIHNSGWVKGPGTIIIKNPSEWTRLEDYVVDILSTFGSDDRVVIWDLYNEPGNNILIPVSKPSVQRNLKILRQLATHFFLPNPTAPLLKKAFNWARAAQPSQPLTTGLWYMREKLESKMNAKALELSDIVTFHSYFDLDTTMRLVAKLRQTNRPLICTEYLARGAGCQFETHLPYFKEQKISCYNWGLVSGKTQTMYSWADYYPSGEEPPLWFHDILRGDGTPYLQEETALIRKLTS